LSGVLASGDAGSAPASAQHALPPLASRPRASGAQPAVYLLPDLTE